MENVFKTYWIFREELRGISRGKDAKDVDWASVAESVVIEEETEKPEPIKISLSDVLKGVKKPTKTRIVKNKNAVETDKNSELHLIICFFYLVRRTICFINVHYIRLDWCYWQIVTKCTKLFTTIKHIVVVDNDNSSTVITVFNIYFFVFY